MSTTSNALLSPSDIADLAKVKRPVVSNWRKRHKDFPSAVAGTEAKPFFSYDEVVDWLRQRGHTIEAPTPGDLIWSALNALRGQVSIKDSADFLLLLATLKVSNQTNFDKIIDELREGRTAKLNDALEELHQVHGLYGNHEAPQSVLQLETDASPVYDAISQISVEELAVAMDSVLERLARSQIKRGAELGFIGSRTSRLIASLVEEKTGIVYDPACGIANILISVFDRGLAKNLVGAEINQYAVSIAKQRAFLRGATIDFVVGDVLTADPDPQLRADVVVAEPPFGMAWNPSSKLVDPRFKFGVPPRRAADLAWVQHAISHLKPDGRAYVLVPPAALSRSSSAERKIRANLLSEGCIEAVVGLPPKMLPHTSINLALLVLRPEGKETDVLMIDASNVDEVEHKVADWLRRDTNQAIDNAVPHAIVPVAQLLSDNADLTTKKWTGQVDVDEEAVASSFITASEAVHQTIQKIDKFSLDIDQLQEVSEPRITTIEELIDNGILEMRMGRSDKLRNLDETSEGRIIRAVDIRNRWLPPLDELEEFTHPDLTEEGDVLITTIKEVRTLVDVTGGHLPSASVDRLRIADQSIITPSYLASVLTGSWNARFQIGATIQRARVRDLEVPLIPVSDQQKINVAQQAVSNLRAQSEDLNKQASVVQNAMLDALRYNVTLESSNSDEHNCDDSENKNNNRL